MIKNLFNNNKILTSIYGLESKKTQQGICIAHLSDLHEKEFGINNWGLFFKVKELQPDIIAITGDLVAHENQKTANVQYTRELAEGLCRIAPTFFVTGNHERKYEEEICEALTQGGVVVLKGGVHTLDIRGARINISGMDDPVIDESHMNSAIASFAQLDGYNVFLTHRPEIYDLCLRKNIDLVLAGHTHAGQVRIPFFSNLYMLGQGWFPKYVNGVFTDGDTTMIISRGLGSSGYPTFRLNNPPDLVAVYIN